MLHSSRGPFTILLIAAALLSVAASVRMLAQQPSDLIGREVSVPHHLMDGEEYTLPLHALLADGQRLFTAVWTSQEGGGRPLSKGTGGPLSDPASPLTFPRNFNRISGPEANSCAGCHNHPYGIAGGSGDIVTNVFVMGQRFDFATFDPSDPMPTRGAVSENGAPATLQTIADSRKTVGMFGSGYIEMLSRQITADLQAVRDSLPPGTTAPLVSKGISFGVLTHRSDGTWDTSGVSGLPSPSVATAGTTPPDLLIRPFSQAGAVVSLRQFTNNAFNQHHGIQSTERVGIGTDPDGDGFANELTRADVTAVTLYQATMAAPGRVIPDDPAVEAAVLRGAKLFSIVGCASCHIPSLPLDRAGWIYTEPNPFNPPGNLRLGDAPQVAVDLTRGDLPQPRPMPVDGVVWVQAYTDFKLHDITTGPGDPNREPLDMLATPGTPDFTDGNGKFLTRRLWGVGNQPPYCHHGQFTTMREAIVAHAGEASAARDAFVALSASDQDDIIEFLKTLQVLPPHTPSLVVDEKGRLKVWSSKLSR